MRKLLITGGTTFVSRYTAEYFAALGDDVTVLNRGSREQVRGVTLIEADRTDLGDKLEGLEFDAVLDICAYTGEHVSSLLDALGATIDEVGARLAATPEEERPSNVIFVVMTDGYENASKLYSSDEIKNMIKINITNR